MCCCSCSSVSLFILDLKEVDRLFAWKLILLKQAFAQLTRNVSGLWLIPIDAVCAVV